MIPAWSVVAIRTPGDPSGGWRILPFMPRHLTCTLLLGSAALFAAPQGLMAQNSVNLPIDTTVARRYFQEAAALTARDAGRLWGRSLAGPLLFVDRASRAVLTDSPDSEGRLRPFGSLYTGTLPASAAAIGSWAPTK